MHSSTRNILDWHHSFKGKNGRKKKVHKIPSSSLFGPLGRKGIKDLFNAVEQSDHMSKPVFICISELG